MANFWLAKTKNEIKAIPHSQCSDGARIWCIDTQTTFRFFRYRNIEDFSYFPTVVIRPTDLPNNILGVWQNEGTIYQSRDVISSIGLLFYQPPFPPATPTQKVVTYYKDSDYPDEEVNLEWIAFYPLATTKPFPQYIKYSDSINSSWKILKVSTVLSNRNPLNEIYSGEGHIWYKKNENRFFFNNHKLFNDRKDITDVYPQSDTWDELQLTDSEIS